MYIISHVLDGKCWQVECLCSPVAFLHNTVVSLWNTINTIKQELLYLLVHFADCICHDTLLSVECIWCSIPPCDVDIQFVAHRWWSWCRRDGLHHGDTECFCCFIKDGCILWPLHMAHSCNIWYANSCLVCWWVKWERVKNIFEEFFSTGSCCWSNTIYWHLLGFTASRIGVVAGAGSTIVGCHVLLSPYIAHHVCWLPDIWRLGKVTDRLL